MPTGPQGDYTAIVVAGNPAGQVNLKDVTSTWYWTPDHKLDKHPDGDGYILGPPGGLVLMDSTSDAMVFNAADALLVAHDYALSHGVPESNIKRAIVVPTSSDLTPHTTASGVSSLIWAPVDDGMVNWLFNDQAIMHEYGHHLERMNDTYASWIAVHDGCWDYKGLKSLPVQACMMPGTSAAYFDAGSLFVNSDEFAWFEGFPTFFSMSASHWDSAMTPSHVSGVRTWPFYHPAGHAPRPDTTL